MRFNDIPGHSHEKQRLIDMARGGRMPHALLLSGHPGLGKLAMARAFASFLHCQNPTPEGDSCGTCPSCRQHRSLNHIDTIYVYPVIKRDSTKPALSDDFIDDWRAFLGENMFASIERWGQILNKGKTNTKPVIYVDESTNLVNRMAYASHGSQYKIVIIWQPERMNEQAANKILKLIEEPFADSLFLLVSDQPDKILPTILSRTQRVELSGYSDSEVAQYLADTHQLSPTDAMALAHLAEGNMITARQLMADNSSRTEYFDWFKDLMRTAYVRDVKRLREWAYALAGESRERQMQFYEFAMRLIRENFIFNFQLQGLNYLTTDEESFSRNFARFISENNVEGIMDVFEKARTDISGNANAKIVNFDAAIAIILLIKNT